MNERKRERREREREREGARGRKRERITGKNYEMRQQIGKFWKTSVIDANQWSEAWNGVVDEYVSKYWF